MAQNIERLAKCTTLLFTLEDKMDAEVTVRKNRMSIFQFTIRPNTHALAFSTPPGRRTALRWREWSARRWGVGRGREPRAPHFERC